MSRVLVLVLGVSLTALVACSSSPAPSAPVSSRRVSLALPADTGDLVTLPLPNAKLTVLDLWAPSCVPCKTSLPALVAREDALASNGAKLVLVAVLSETESTELARSTLASWGVHHSFVIDRGDAARTQTGADALPATVILTAEGDVRWRSSAGATADDVVRAAR